MTKNATIPHDQARMALQMGGTDRMMRQRWVGSKTMRLSLLAGLLVALTLALAGCVSGLRKCGPATVLSPGSVNVTTNGAMPVLRVEAFQSEGRKP
jgi:hypothetical protein